MSTTILNVRGVFHRFFVQWALLCGAVLAGQSALVTAAEFPEDSPHALVQEVTDELLVVIEEHRRGFEVDPEPFLEQIDAMLQDVMDFRWIARSVMGPYFQQASEDQVDRFARVFRTSLIETYGHGLMNFGDETIEVVPPRPGQLEERRVSVTQRIHSGGNIYPVVYSMARNREGEWKVINVIINGINLGMTFRNQFQQAAQQQDGNLDRVIEGWSPAVEIDTDTPA